MKRRASAPSLALRLTAWYAGASLVLLLVSTQLLYWVVKSAFDREDDQALAEKVAILEPLLSRPGELKVEVARESSSRMGATLIRVVGPGEELLAETPGMSAVIPAPVGESAVGTLEVASRSGRAYRVVVARVPAAGGSAVIQVALDRVAEESLLARYRRALWVILAAGLVVSVAAGSRIARHALRPVDGMIETVRHIRSTRIGERVNPAGFPRELSLLARTFNEMLDRLEEAFGRLTRFSSDLAHELRTPLGNLTGETEVALSRGRTPDEYRHVLESSLEEYGRLSRLVESLLFLARAESGTAGLAPRELELSEETETVREFYGAAAEERGVAITCRGGASLHADPVLLQRALANLVSNALAHTPRGGTVEITAAQEPGGAVVVEVRDTGCGIAPEDLSHVFERFYRARRDAEGAGSGLGLAIVRSVVELHGGVAAAASSPGRGATFTLRFPRSQAASSFLASS